MAGGLVCEAVAAVGGACMNEEEEIGSSASMMDGHWVLAYLI